MSFSREILAAGNSAESSKAIVGPILRDLIATGANQASALEILEPICIFATVAAGTGARLPWTGNNGDLAIIANKGANDLLVYPPVGGTIDGAAVDAPFTHPVGKTVLYWCTEANTWIVLSPGAAFNLTVDDEGVPVGANINELDFVGAGVVATAVGPKATITVAGGCPLDLEPVVLQFGAPGTGGAANPNTVVKYDLSAPGTVFARTSDVAELGAGGTTYAPATFDSSGPTGMYNPWDDKIYFLADKTVPGPTTTYVLVQFDPRTLLITNEMELPASWTTANSVLVDVADSWCWIQSSFDGTLRAFSLVSFTEMFTDGGVFANPPFSTAPSDIACAAGQILIPDSASAEILHLITVTGATTYNDTVIPLPVGTVLSFTVDGPSRRRWITDRNKVVLTQSGGAAPLVLDLNDLSVQSLYVAAGTFQGGNGPYWDAYLHRVVGLSGVIGFAIGDDTGAILGDAGDGVNWFTSRPMTLGKLALFYSGIADKLGGFNESVPTTTPEEEYETSDTFVSPGGNTFFVDNACVALRRKDCISPETPQQGTTLSYEYSGTGGAMAYFQRPGALAGDDNIQWVPGTGVVNALNNDAATYSTGAVPGTATATFTTVDGKTVTVTNGLITSVV